MGWREKLVLARKAKGLSQAELGQRIGMRQGTISKWESTDGGALVDDVIQAITSLGVDPTWLFSDAPDEFPSDLERAARELFEAKLRAEGARAVLDMLVSLHAQRAPDARPLAPTNLTVTTVSDPRPPRGRRRRKPGPGPDAAMASDQDLHGKDEGADR